MATAQSAHKVLILCILMSRMERYVMATAQSAHKVTLFVVWYGVVRSRMKRYVMARAQSAHKVTLFDLFGLVTCQCASRINFPNFETTRLMMDDIPDSKYQGYLGPQGALDSPSGSHRAHWKFRKVIS